MSDPAPFVAVPRTKAAPRPDVQVAIARASQATGIDFGYLLGQARLESGLNPNARARTSSATGLYQFTQGTWLATLDKHGSAHGYGWADAKIEHGKVKDPVARQQILAMRNDPMAASLMAAELASDNRDVLVGVLGREPDAAELYLAHFLGADGASRFLTALGRDPGQSAAALFPQAAAANRPIFYGSGGAPRSLGEVMGLLRGKMASAMGMEGPSDLRPSPAERGWGWGGEVEWPSVNASVEPPTQPFPTRAGLSSKSRPSMAETLSATFGGSPGAMPGHVRGAYGKLKAFGL